MSANPMSSIFTLAITLAVVVAGGAIAAGKDPLGNPCALLTDAEVRRVFPDARPAARDTRFEQAGGDIASCVWQTSRGGFTASITRNAQPLGNEIREWSLLMVNPMGDQPRAGDKIRYEQVAGVGDAAMAVLEAPNAILPRTPGIAFLIARRGDRELILASQELPGRERAGGLAALAELAHAAMKRF